MLRGVKGVPEERGSTAMARVVNMAERVVNMVDEVNMAEKVNMAARVNTVEKEKASIMVRSSRPRNLQEPQLSRKHPRRPPSSPTSYPLYRTSHATRAPQASLAAVLMAKPKLGGGISMVAQVGP